LPQPAIGRHLHNDGGFLRARASADVDHGLHQFSSAPLRRCDRRARSGRLSMADSVLVAIFESRAVELGRPVGAERLAELCDHDSAAALRAVAGLENRAFTAANRVAARKRRSGSGAAQPIRHPADASMSIHEIAPSGELAEFVDAYWWSDAASSGT